MEKTILATLENYDGLPADMVERLQKMSYANDQIFSVKKMELVKGSCKVLIEVATRDGKESYLVDSENLNLFEKYDEDYKIYDPMKDPEFNCQKEKGEN